MDLIINGHLRGAFAFFAATTPALAYLAYLILNRVRVKSLIRNIPGPKADSWLAGNFPEIYDVLNIRWHHETTRKYGNIVQVNGMFGDEQLYVTDPRALYQIIVKEQSIFEEPQSLLVMNGALLGNGLLATIGDYHKRQRKILNPIFSVKHMRELVPIFDQVTQRLCSALHENLKHGPLEININEWTSRTALEFIAKGGLGTSLDSLIDGETSNYTTLSKQLVPTVSRLYVPMQLLPLVKPLFVLLPGALQETLLQYSPIPAVRRLKGITDRLEATSREVLQRRKEDVIAEIEDSRGEKGKDILSILLRANIEAPVDERLPDDEVVAHLTTLIFNAQDTTSSAISRTLHLLSQNTDAQDRLRREIRDARSFSGDTNVWDYDKLMRLPFLDAVVRETLRLHGPVSWIWRVARKPTALPLIRPIIGTDGKPIHSIPVAKNQGLIVGIAAANRDESVWGPDAWVWKPERWLTPSAEQAQPDEAGIKGSNGWKSDAFENDALKDAKYPGVYSGMMTFSGGGRSCIGFKFALLGIKTVVATLIESFSFALPSEEIVWNMNHIAAPTLKGKETEPPQMPLKVTLIAQ